jgi:GxxExxY protein
VPADSDPETFAIIGAAMAVHTELGHGFLEAVYRAALRAELEIRNGRLVNEAVFPVIYRGVRLPVHYRADFVCFGSIIVEVKAARALGPMDEAQVLNYLKASGHKRALLLNFGAARLQYRRFVW